MDGHCQDCIFNSRIVGNEVMCRSKRHAQFMDIAGARNYQDKRYKYGFIALKSTHAVGMLCHDCEKGG